MSASSGLAMAVMMSPTFSRKLRPMAAVYLSSGSDDVKIVDQRSQTRPVEHVGRADRDIVADVVERRAHAGQGHVSQRCPGQPVCGQLHSDCVLFCVGIGLATGFPIDDFVPAAGVIGKNGVNTATDKPVANKGLKCGLYLDR